MARIIYPSTRDVSFVPGKSSETRIRTVARDFDAFDAKGRKIGGQASIFSRSFVAFSEAEGAEGSSRACYSIVPREFVGRTFFGYRPHALRDGKEFGALQGSMLFETLEEAEAAVLEYFAGAEKRANKKARA